jgi:hypothetical protein
MVRRAAERQGPAEPIERRQQPIEEHGVLDRELARQRYYGANATRRSVHLFPHRSLGQEGEM